VGIGRIDKHKLLRSGSMVRSALTLARICRLGSASPDSSWFIIVFVGPLLNPETGRRCRQLCGERGHRQRDLSIAP
jgi:hypothetical protein